jgi:hypothetical protein
MVLGKLGILMEKTETRVLPLTLHKTNSKWIKDIETSRSNCRENA